MITKNPENYVIAFNLLEWLVEWEPAPKKEVKNFLRDCYANISKNKVKVDAGNEDEDKQNEVEDDDNSDLKELFLDTAYDHFSLTEDGAVLLISKNEGSINLLLTGTDARDLLPKLKAKLEDRVVRLSKLLK